DPAQPTPMAETVRRCFDAFFRREATGSLRVQSSSHEGYLSPSRTTADLYRQFDLHDWKRHEYCRCDLVHPAKDTQRDGSRRDDGHTDDSRASDVAVHGRHH